MLKQLLLIVIPLSNWSELPVAPTSPIRFHLKGYNTPTARNTKYQEAAGKNKLSPQKVNTHSHVHRQETFKTTRSQVSRKIKKSTTRGEEMSRGSTEQTMF